MKIGFDLDGVLDRPALRDLCLSLLQGQHEVHIITGIFPEAGEWQNMPAKREKMDRLRIPYTAPIMPDPRGGVMLHKHAFPGTVMLHVLDAVPPTFDRDYRLADLGLRKGALCERLGIEMFFDDSEEYCKMIPKMSGATTVLQVR